MENFHTLNLTVTSGRSKPLPYGSFLFRPPCGVKFPFSRREIPVSRREIPVSQREILVSRREIPVLSVKNVGEGLAPPTFSLATANEGILTTE